jgi:hypothetical protein
LTRACRNVRIWATEFGELSSAPSVDSHLLEQNDCLIGVFWPAEKKRLLVTEIRATSRPNTSLSKPIYQAVKIGRGMIVK